MEYFNERVATYQERIGAYDRQLWEKWVEQSVLKGLHNMPNKIGRVKPELIDVDLVRGSTFSRAKPQHSWCKVTFSGIVHVLVMPFYFRWWEEHTSKPIAFSLLLLYLMQVFTITIYCGDPLPSINNTIIRPANQSGQVDIDEQKWLQSLSISHLSLPLTLMFILGIIHAHMMSSSEMTRKRKRVDNDRSRQTLPTDRILTSDMNALQQAVIGGSGSHQELPPHCSNGVKRKISSQDCTVTSTTPIPATITTPNPATSTTPKPPTRTTSRSDIHQTFDHLPPSLIFTTPSNKDVCLSSSIRDVTIPAPLLDINYQCEEAFKNSDGIRYRNRSNTLTNENVERSLPNTPAEVCRQCSDPINPTLYTMVTPTRAISIDAAANKSGSESEISDNSININQEDRLSSDEKYEKAELSSEYPNRRSGSFAGRSATSINQARRKVCKTAAQRSHETLVSRRYCNSCSQEVLSRPLYDEETQTSHVTSREVTADSSGGEENISGNQSGNQKNKLRVPRTRATLNSDWDESVQSEVACCSSDTSSDEVSSTITKAKMAANANSIQKSMENTCNPVSGDINILKSSTSMSASLHSTMDIQQTSSLIKNLSTCNDRISCMIWDADTVKKLDLTILDIGWTIIDRVEKQYNTLYGDRNMLSSVMVLASTVLPLLFRMYHTRSQLSQLSPYCLASFYQAMTILFGNSWRHIIIILNGIIQRFFLSLLFYFFLSVAERTFKQRFLYAKNFCHLTSTRRARKYELPHFRLNKVRNIKYWLSLRSFLKKQGPQRSVDAIVSFTFIITVMLVSYMCVELLRDTGTFLEHLSNWELMLWCLTLGLYELHYMTLGTKINKKYRNFSVLITEQINLYLHMEQKPHKKEELMLANNVLRLAENLLKELDSPFKISGLSANPYLYNITKVVILSAFSAVLTELLGFKLKLYKIKLR